ncbi:hypothetical protein LMF32_05410 [Desemzia sp. C1]|uniref:hypothetical protein n=1 Tax=Desemzia sp. C1 TaxID=2892016 RepID=UPI001E4A2AAC|nr:hypothetical protein [Desemzia sp. C1]MCI3028537.1 hypothetical protein [Desemzia sp. C1]
MINRKYLFKGLFLVVLVLGTVNYVFNTSSSEVTISSLFILIAAVIYVRDEVSLSTNDSDNRNKYQKWIDRLFAAIFIVISIDTVISFLIYGIS